MISESINTNTSSTGEKHRQHRNVVPMDEFLITFYYTLVACITRGLFSWVLLACRHKAKILTWWVSWILPLNSDGIINPGLLFGHPWLLLGWKNHSKSSSSSRVIIPNLPIRVSETVAGRFSYRDLAIILPIHFSSAALAMTFWNKVLLLFAQFEEIQKLTFSPIIYSEEEYFTSWLFALIMEALANALLCIPILVLPELFSLNGIPRALRPIIAAHFMSFTGRIFRVDHTGGTTTYSPTLLYGFYWINNNNYNNINNQPQLHTIIPWGQSCHLIGPLLGGVLGGLIMKIFFPDSDSF